MPSLLDFLASPIMKTVDKVLDRVLPDPAAKAAAQLELVKLQQTGELAQLAAETQVSLGQIDVNKQDAQSASVFVSGWRPFVGWICGSGLGFQVVAAPLLEWGSTLVGHATKFPTLDTSVLLTLLMGMLGLGGMRTYEKVVGVARR
jgi:hypothetical protein